MFPYNGNNIRTLIVLAYYRNCLATFHLYKCIAVYSAFRLSLQIIIFKVDIKLSCKYVF